VGPYARAHLARGGGHPGRSHAQFRYRGQCLAASDRLRGRCQARPDPHQSACGDARAGHRAGYFSRSRGGAAVPGIPRSGARFRLLSLRPGEAALHHARADPVVPARCAGRYRDTRGRERCRRAALIPRRHAGTARPAVPLLWGRQVQRLRYVLLPGRIQHLGGLFWLPGHRCAWPGGRAECGRREGIGIEFLPAARPGGARTALYPTGRGGTARNPASDLQLHPLRRVATARAARRDRSRSTRRIPQAAGHARRGTDPAGIRGRRRPRSGRHTARR
jgi:hypothetical protein